MKVASRGQKSFPSGLCPSILLSLRQVPTHRLRYFLISKTSPVILASRTQPTNSITSFLHSCLSIILFFHQDNTNKMATAVLTRKTGVIVGDDVQKLFKYCHEKKFAIPAIVYRLLYEIIETFLTGL